MAVLDTGIDYHHPDLTANVIDGVDISGDHNDEYMDHHGHGTHVAGIIAASGYLLGVAPDCRLLAVKVLDDQGKGRSIDVQRGLAWARRWRGDGGRRVDVINVSLGTPLPGPALHNEIKQCLRNGITVICAAGNSGDGLENTREISYPAYYDETISVGAVDLNTGIANFSNSNPHIDIVAPGVDTYSTYPGGRYVQLSGTSMAAPHIAGAAALIYSRWRDRFGKDPTAAQVRDMIHYHALDLGKTGFDHLYGYGLFSFNPAGGRAIRMQAGKHQCTVNGRETPLRGIPMMAGDYFYAALEDVCQLTDMDHLKETGDGDGNSSEFEVWS